MLDAIHEALWTNHRINMMLLDAISDDGLAATLSTRGGRGVAGQFAHMHNVRRSHLERRGKGLHEDLVKFAAKEVPDRGAIRAAHEASTERLVALFDGIEAGTMRSMKKGPVVYLSYFVAHEAHHRGSILLTVKTSGHPVDKDTRFAIWDWGRA